MPCDSITSHQLRMLRLLYVDSKITSDQMMQILKRSEVEDMSLLKWYDFDSVAIQIIEQETKNNQNNDDFKF
jgi:molecular chaperone GrpE (heat shock protein)